MLEVLSKRQFLNGICSPGLCQEQEEIQMSHKMYGKIFPFPLSKNRIKFLAQLAPRCRH